MNYVLGLYRDVNNLLQVLNSADRDTARRYLTRIVGRLKAINTMGHQISWYFFVHFPIRLILELEDSPFDRKRIRFFLLNLRNTLEKMIIGKGSFRIIQRKDIYVDLKNPAVSLAVPAGFEKMIPGFEYIEGRIPIITTAAHAKPPGADTHIETIVRILTRKTGAHGLIATISRIYMDPNRIFGRLSPFRQLLEGLALSRKIKLIIDLHTLRKRNENLVEIGTWYGISISKKYLEPLLEALSNADIKFEISTKYVGGDITFYHSNRPIINAVQLEISNGITTRDMRRLIKALTQYINKVGGKNRARRSGQ